MKSNKQTEAQKAQRKKNELDLLFKVFQVLIRTEQDPNKKYNAQHVLHLVKTVKNNSAFAQLMQENRAKLEEIKAMFRIYKGVFDKLTGQNEKYREFKNPSIFDILLNVQQKIQPKNFKNSYCVALTLKIKSYEWTKQFVKDWVKTAQEWKNKEQTKQQSQNQKDTTNKNSANTNNNKNNNTPIKSKPVNNDRPNQSHGMPVRQSPTSAQSIKVQEKPQLKQIKQKSPQFIPGQKPEKKQKRENQAVQKSQKQKKTQIKSKKQIGSDDSQGQEDTLKQDAKKRQQMNARQRMQYKFQKPKQPKNRVNQLVKYLQSRKQFSSLHSNNVKKRQMAEFLNKKLEQFMKHHLFNLIEIAKLRNRRHQTLLQSGNQFTYFSKEGCSLKKSINNTVALQPSKMLKVNYRSKFEIYSMLRTREQLLEQEMLKEFSSKKDQDSINRNDKKFWEYLLRQNKGVQKTPQYVQMQEQRTQRLSIQITHIRCLFQSHNFIRNSWLMLNCYNS